MRKLLSLLMLIGLTANAQVDKKLKPYVLNFEKYFDVKVDTKIEFGSFLGDAIAVSVKGKNHVIINKQKFNSLDLYGKYVVIYHELGHAFFDMRHDENNRIMRADAQPKIKNGVEESYYTNFKRGRKQMKKQLQNGTI